MTTINHGGPPASLHAGQPTISDVLAVVMKACAVSICDLRASGRHPDIVRARELAICLSVHFADASFPRISLALGRASHTGMFEAYWRVQRRSKHEDEWVRLWSLCVNGLGAKPLRKYPGSRLDRMAVSEQSHASKNDAES